MRQKRLTGLLCAVLFALAGFGGAAWAQENQPPPDAGKTKKTQGMYNRRAYNAHRLQIDAFRKVLAGLKLDQMGDSALADMSLNTDLMSYRKDGRLVIEMIPREPDPMQDILEQALWRYAFLNRHEGEWNNNYNDWLHTEDIFADMKNLLLLNIIPPPPPITCPTYFDSGGHYRTNNDGSITYIHLWGWYCPVEAEQYPGRCP